MYFVTQSWAGCRRWVGLTQKDKREFLAVAVVWAETRKVGEDSDLV